MWRELVRGVFYLIIIDVIRWSLILANYLTCSVYRNIFFRNNVLFVELVRFFVNIFGENYIVCGSYFKLAPLGPDLLAISF